MRKKPKVGQVWYCNFNNAYFVIIGVLDKRRAPEYHVCKIKWTDTLEQDEVAVKTLLTHESFSYITG